MDLTCTINQIFTQIQVLPKLLTMRKQSIPFLRLCNPRQYYAESDVIQMDDKQQTKNSKRLTLSLHTPN